jgi:outer membrane protein TolC
MTPAGATTIFIIDDDAAVRASIQALLQGPDIASAERLMASANAQIGAAKAAYYPTITLGATGGFESGMISTLLTGPSALWSVGGSAVGNYA